MQNISLPTGVSPYVAYGPPSVLNRPIEGTAVQQDVLPAEIKSKSYQAFVGLRARDTKRGALTEDGKELLDAFLNPGESQNTKVHVLSFGVHGVRANDMFMVRRTPPVLGKTNVVLYMPDKNQPAFHEFGSSKEIHKFFKEVPNNPAAFKAFLGHFGRDARLESVETVRQAMQEWASAPEGSKLAWALGGMSYINSDVFKLLDDWSKQSNVIPIVNGLTDIQIKEVSGQGVVTYMGYRPNGESVSFRYDMLDNLMGAGSNGTVYYLKNAKSSNKPLAQITPNQLGSTVIEDLLKVLREGGVEGAGKETGDFLEHPFKWVSELLQAFGAPKAFSEDVEKFLDNPVTFLLLYANKYNALGFTFGKRKDEMDKILAAIGDKVQGAVPVYGQARALLALAGKGLKNEPLTDKEVRDGAEALELKTSV